MKGKVYDLIGGGAESRISVILSLYVVFVVFSPDFVVDSLAFSSHAFEFRLSDLFFLVMLGYTVYTFAFEEKKLTLPTLLVPALIYVGTFFVGALVAYLRVGGSLGLQAMFFSFKYLEYFLIFFVTVNLVQSPKQVGKLLRFLLFTSSIAAGLLILSRVIDSLHLTLTIGFPSLSPKFHHLYNSRATLPFAKGFGPSAEFLMLVIPLALFFFLYSERVSSKFIYFSSAVLLGLGFVLTGSRGPMAGLFVAIVLVAPVLEKRLLPWIFGGLLGLTGLYFAGGFVSKRIDSIIIVFSQGVCANNSMCVRVTRIWPEGLNQFLHHPIFGKGVASFPTSDTQYIRLLADQGLVGLFAFAFFIYSLFFYLVKLRKSSDYSSLAMGLSSALIVSLLALLVNGITATAFEPVRAMEPFWFLLGLAFSFESFGDHENLRPYKEVEFGKFG